jgi:hypothetical protein
MYLAQPLVALAATFLASAQLSQPITPLSIEYSNSAEESGEAKICEIVAVLRNLGPPERVTISAFAGYDKSEGAVAVGFMVGVAKQSFDGDLEIVNVTSAAFTSDSFNSADELDHEVSGERDGLFMAATADADVANRFLRSVVAGGFYLTISSDDPETSDWTYRVKDGPPAEVQERFARCLDDLELSTVSLREAHLPSPRAQ